MNEMTQPETVAPLAEAIEGNEDEIAAFAERLDEVNDLLDLLGLAGGAADDEMVTALAGTASGAGTLADAATEPETVRGLESMLHAVGEATSDATPPEHVGVIGLLKALRDPEVQAGLGFLIAVSRNLGHDLDRQASYRE